MVDLTGQVFGFLTCRQGINPTGNKRSHAHVFKDYLCDCDCGSDICPQTNIPKSAYQLAQGRVRSCGSLRVTLNLSNEITKGATFGRLTATGVHIPRVGWEFDCFCDSGEKFYHDAKDVLNGNTKSCGCLGPDKWRGLAITLLNRKTDPEPIEVLAKAIYSRRYKDGTLDYDTYRKMIDQPCDYCGVVGSCEVVKKPSVHSFVADYPIEQRTLFHNGIDRIVSYNLTPDGTKQRTTHDLGNVCTACYIDNMGKRDMDQMDYIRHLIRIANHRIDTTPEEHRSQWMNIDDSFFDDRSKRSMEKSIRHIFTSKGVKYNNGDLNLRLFYQLSQLDCYWCGMSAQTSNLTNRAKQLTKSSQHFKDTGDYLYNGLDRIHSYTEIDGAVVRATHTYDNVIPCCALCNWIKSNYPLEDWMAWWDRIHQWWAGKQIVNGAIVLL